MSSFRNARLCGASLGITIALSLPAAAEVVRVATELVDNKLDLVELEVTSDAPSGLPNRIVPFAGLTPTTVTDFASVAESNAANTLTVLATPDSVAPVGDERLRLLGDRHLNTGVFNPSYGSPGVLVTFDTPVVNGPGVDMVLFELTIGSGQTPDPIEVLLPGRPEHTYKADSEAYQRRGSITAAAAPRTFEATVASGGFVDLLTLRDSTLAAVGVTSNPRWHAIGIDFDAMGIAPWQPVTSLEILSDNPARNTPVDLLMVVGLPPVTQPADFDRDLFVSPLDYNRWAMDYGGAGASDGNGDGVIDAADYTVWRDAFEASLQSTAAVPEPQTWLLAAAAALAAIDPLRRQRAPFIAVVERS
jgi:hypothetical protein